MPLLADMERKLEMEYWKRVSMGKGNTPFSQAQKFWLKLLKGLWGENFDVQIKTDAQEKQRVEDYFHIVYQDIDPILEDCKAKRCKRNLL